MSTLFIMHIPKTAGTSLNLLVRENQPDAVGIYKDELALYSTNPSLIGKLRDNPPSVVMGHFSFGAHRMLGVSPRYATVLRDPVERVISLFQHLVRQNSDAVKGRTLRGFVAAGINEQTNNHMCRTIGGISSESGLLFSEQWPVDLAMHMLRRHYELIGTTDNLSGFVKSLGQTLGWRSTSTPRVNVADSPAPEFDQETIETIRHHNQSDIALFKLVRDMAAS